MFDVQLIFAAPRNADEIRVFDVVAQGKVVASKVTVRPDAAQQTLRIPGVAIKETLRLEFVGSENGAVLCGVGLTRGE